MLLSFFRLSLAIRNVWPQHMNFKAFAVHKFILERKQEDMKHLLKGAAVAAVVLVALMVINMFCNMHGIHLDQTATGATSAVNLIK